jgi:hypothetical protein
MLASQSVDNDPVLFRPESHAVKRNKRWRTLSIPGSTVIFFRRDHPISDRRTIALLTHLQPPIGATWHLGQGLRIAQALRLD